MAPPAEVDPCHWPGTLAFLLFSFVSPCFSLFFLFFCVIIIIIIITIVVVVIVIVVVVLSD